LPETTARAFIPAFFDRAEEIASASSTSLSPLLDGMHDLVRCFQPIERFKLLSQLNDSQLFFDRKAGITHRLRLIGTRANRSALTAFIDQEPKPRPFAPPN
jgi:hypothetical protein